MYIHVNGSSNGSTEVIVYTCKYILSGDGNEGGGGSIVLYSGSTVVVRCDVRR